MINVINKITVYSDATLRDAMQAIGEGEIGIAILVEKDTKFYNKVLEKRINQYIKDRMYEYYLKSVSFKDYIKEV